MAYNFNNKTKKQKFNGIFTYNNLTYEYALYLPILTKKILIEPERSEVITKFGNRMQNGKLCLNRGESLITTHLDNGDVSAYIIVNQVGSDETGSGTLQIYDWCSGNNRRLLKNRFVWINDVCRILGPTGVKTAVSPIGALFYFMEQLTVQNMGKTDIYLFVDTHDNTNKTVLTNIYSKNYGFILNSEDNPSICPGLDPNDNSMVMKKPSLVADTRVIDFSFLNKRSRVGKRKTSSRKTSSHKTSSRKTSSHKTSSRKKK
jgi:hypothetical protein